MKGQRVEEASRKKYLGTDRKVEMHRTAQAGGQNGETPSMGEKYMKYIDT